MYVTTELHPNGIKDGNRLGLKKRSDTEATYDVEVFNNELLENKLLHKVLHVHAYMNDDELVLDNVTIHKGY